MPATPCVPTEFKAEITKLVQRGDRTIGQVASGFNL